MGNSETPILSEISAIECNLHRFADVVVLIDDWRCFDPKQQRFREYPPRSQLVAFAERNDMTWTVEHDIFVCSNTPLRP